MCEIYAQALSLRKFLPNNENIVKKEKSNTNTYLEVTIFSYLFCLQLLHQFILRSYAQITKNKSNYNYIQKQNYQSTSIITNIFWYIYSDIYDFQKYTPPELYYLQYSKP